MKSGKTCCMREGGDGTGWMDWRVWSADDEDNVI
jgi:hypothetical protein